MAELFRDTAHALERENTLAEETNQRTKMVLALLAVEVCAFILAQVAAHCRHDDDGTALDCTGSSELLATEKLHTTLASLAPLSVPRHNHWGPATQKGGLSRRGEAKKESGMRDGDCCFKEEEARRNATAKSNQESAYLVQNVLEKRFPAFDLVPYRHFSGRVVVATGAY
eukprot:935367-Rhodomonas_salina.1